VTSNVVVSYQRLYPKKALDKMLF